MAIDYKVLGKRIRKYRYQRNTTQEALSFTVGVSKAHMSHIETGATKVSLSVLSDIANALGVGIDALVGESLDVSTPVFKKEIEEIINDCTPQELRYIIDYMVITKNMIRNLQKNESED